MKPKFSYIFNIVLIIVLAIVLLFPDKKTSSDDMRPSTIDVIHSRKSVRHFTGEKVTDDQLLTLAKAGMAAPSARNCPVKSVSLYAVH